jgi:release factor glutamine methyltransferase
MSEISSQVYPPAEDSFLLEREILSRDLKGKVCLDLGTGSGILAIAMLKAGADFIVCADINKVALKKSRENVHAFVEKEKKGFNGKLFFVETNLFSNLKGANFDFVTFNPPYVPSDEIKWADLDGGKDGRETIYRFISQFAGHLSSSAEVLLLVSSLNKPSQIISSLKKQDFLCKKLSSQKIFFEELTVFSIKKK